MALEALEALKEMRNWSKALLLQSLQNAKDLQASTTQLLSSRQAQSNPDDKAMLQGEIAERQQRIDSINAILAERGVLVPA
jgi:hypothetical protein